MARRHMSRYEKWLWLIALIASLSPLLAADRANQGLSTTPRVLLITAHPDDETMCCMGRFHERGWKVSIALVTNGEAGSIIQGIKPNYDPARDSDILTKTPPGEGVWLTVPPDGPRLAEIRTPTELASERRREFLQGAAAHGLVGVYFLSSLAHGDFEDSKTNGAHNWDQTLLNRCLIRVAQLTQPTLIVTLNPDETWAHGQHWELGRIVATLYDRGALDTPGQLRPVFYGIRENGWYDQSKRAQPGDLVLRRQEGSSVLGESYEQYWIRTTGPYISQSSHPVWFQARVDVGLLPGYEGVEILRRLDANPGQPGLDTLFRRYPPNADLARRLPATPQVVYLSPFGP